MGVGVSAAQVEPQAQGLDTRLLWPLHLGVSKELPAAVAEWADTAEWLQAEARTPPRQGGRQHLRSGLPGSPQHGAGLRHRPLLERVELSVPMHAPDTRRRIGKV